MSIDKELERAVAETDAEASVPAVAQAASPGGPHKPRSKSNVGLLVGLLVIVGGVLGLVLMTGGNAAIYSVGVDQLMKDQPRYSQRNLRVKGMLVKGTLARRDDPCEYRFKLQEKDQVLPVQFAQCIVPDTFRDMPGMDVEVTAEGKLAANGTAFEATAIMAKCPSKYEMKSRQAGGELAPHAGPQASPLQNL